MVRNVSTTNFQSSTVWPAAVNGWPYCCVKRACEACHTGVNGVDGPQQQPPMTTLSNASSEPISLTGSGLRTSRSIARVMVGFTAAPLLMLSPAVSWAGLLLTDPPPNSSRTPWKWPAGNADPGPELLFTPIAERNTRVGSSDTDYVKRGSWVPWDESPPAWTTPSSNHSGQPCNANYSTASPGTVVSNWLQQFSNGSKGSTTPADATPP